MKKYLNISSIFRIISVIEGLSYIYLMFYVMPLKYIYNELALMKSIGMIHGILFILFVIFLFSYKKIYKINNDLAFDFFIYSLTPFGFILIEKRIKKQ